MSFRSQERGLNWTLEEKNVLIDLIETKKNIIENKHSDLSSVMERNNAWSDIGRRFNAKFPTGRDPQKIKEQYQRLKSHAKKEILEYYRISRLVPSAPCPSELSWRISALAPNDFKQNNCCSADIVCPDVSSNLSTSTSSVRDGPALKEETLVSANQNTATHMLVTPKIEVDPSDEEDECHGAETYLVGTQNGETYSDGAEQSDDVGSDSVGLQSKPIHTSSGRQKSVFSAATERTRGQDPYSRKRHRAILEDISTERSHSYTGLDQLGKMRKVADSCERLSSFMQDSLHTFYKTEHELKMKHLTAEHTLRMEILNLKKQLLEKKIAAQDLNCRKSHCSCKPETS